MKVADLAVNISLQSDDLMPDLKKALNTAENKAGPIDVALSIESKSLTKDVDKAVSKVKPDPVKVPVEMDEASADRAIDSFDLFATRASIAAGGIGDLAGALADNGIISEEMAEKAELASSTIMGFAGVADLTVISLELLKSAKLKDIAATTLQKTAWLGQKVAMVATTVATYAMAAAQRVLNAAMKANPIGLVLTAITALVAVIVVAYKKNEKFREIVQKVWEGIKNAIGSVVDWFKDTVWPLLKKVIDFIVGYYKFLWRIVKTVWDGILAAIKTVVDWFRNTAWPWIKGVIDKLRGAFETVRDRIKAAWDGIKNGIKAGWDFIRDRIFTPLKNAVDSVRGAFQTAKDKIGTIWNGIKSLLAKPVNFVINTVWNNGLRKAINLIPGVNINRASPIPGYALGGVLPGYTPGRDVHRFYSPTGGALDLSGGEGIMRPEWVKAMGGARAIDAMNKAAKKGLYHGGYAQGGIFAPVKNGSYGGRIHGSPPAIDIGLRTGTPVYAGHAGTVTGSYDIRGYEPRAPHGGLGYRSYGRVIKISGGGLSTLYAHLSERIAQRGQHVAGGELIGLGGNTGHSFGPHLHFGASGLNPKWFGAGSRTYTGAGDGDDGGSWLSRAKDVVKHFTFDLPRHLRNFSASLGPAREWLSGMAKGFLNKGVDFVNSKIPGWLNWLPGVPLPHFDNGGVMPHGALGVNTSGRPEAVLTNDQWRTLDRVASRGGAPTVHIEHATFSDRVDIDALMQQVEFYANAGRV